MRIGDLVILVEGDGYMPPLGSIGEIVGWDGEDFAVEFARHPCPNPPGTFWYASPAWLRLIRGGALVFGDASYWQTFSWEIA